ncbi:uncharacterized protein LOC135693182 [Rhopilema esculentum]|uniref:uncharacterized protein LOC135693182 n=1 Tax=Rhopilema esculentum TaxID=499914 RepID=UPI0031DAF933
MAYTQSKKGKGVGYFNHFPKNFLKPYGRVETYPPEQVALTSLRPEGCEWLRRPHVATSELCSTVTDNLEVLQKPSLLLDDSKKMDFTRNLQPVAQLLAPFHKESQTVPNDVKRRNLLLALLNPGNTLGAQLDECVELVPPEPPTTIIHKTNKEDKQEVKPNCTKKRKSPVIIDNEDIPQAKTNGEGKKKDK